MVSTTTIDSRPINQQHNQQTTATTTMQAMLAHNDAARRVELVADRPYSIGEPLYAWCGPQPNSRLLLNYVSRCDGHSFAHQQHMLLLLLGGWFWGLRVVPSLPPRARCVVASAPARGAAAVSAIEISCCTAAAPQRAHTHRGAAQQRAAERKKTPRALANLKFEPDQSFQIVSNQHQIQTNSNQIQTNSNQIQTDSNSNSNQSRASSTSPTPLTSCS